MHQYDFDCPTAVHVLTRLGGGSVEIVAEQRNTATVQVAPYDDSESAREAAANTRVDLRDGRLVVEAPEAAGWLFRRSPRLRVDIRLPLDCTLQVNVASAEANCHGRYASAVVNSASGDVRFEQVTGDLSANTASGDLRLGHVGGQLRVNAASGDISVQAVDGEVTAHTASGDIEIARAGAGVNAKTASGDVRVGTARRGDIRVTSASGDVSVGVAEGTGVWLDLTTMSGATRSDLAVGEAVSEARKDLTVQVRTLSGDIDVHRVAGPPVGVAERSPQSTDPVGVAERSPRSSGPVQNT